LLIFSFSFLCADVQAASPSKKNNNDKGIGLRADLADCKHMQCC
jgi:hypothetical protein